MAFKHSFLKNLLSKLGLNDERTLRKASEFQRILDLKISCGGAKTLKIDEMCKAIICIDIAAVQTGAVCEKDDLIKLSGLKRGPYNTNRNVVEKLLGQDEIMDVNKLCVQLGISEISSFAQTILDKYEENNRNFDGNSKVLTAVAVYVACRVKKIKVDNTRLLELSQLKRPGFKKLADMLTKLLVNSKEGTVLQENDKNIDENGKTLAEPPKAVKRESSIPVCEAENESYSAWKRRMLEELKSSDSED